MAGTIVGQSIKELVGNRLGMLSYVKRIIFTDDASHSGISNASIGDFGGNLTALRVKFGSPAPSGLTITIKDSDGVTLIDAETISATGIIALDSTIPFDGLTITITGNTTASAVATIIFYFF